ncbi:MAG: hypothetical protein RL038_189 [Actinomycetota bacterium]
MGINGLIAAGGDAPSGAGILFPAIYDLIWGGVSFLILITLFTKYVLPRFNKVLAERQEKIEGGFKRAEAAQAKANETLESLTTQLSAARDEAANIRAAAAEEKRKELDKVRAEAEELRSQSEARSRETIQAEKAQAESDLQRGVGALALDLASKVVGESLQDDARARAVVDAFIADLERQANEAGR